MHSAILDPTRATSRSSSSEAVITLWIEPKCRSKFLATVWPHAGNGRYEILLLLLKSPGRLVAVRLGTGIWVLKKSGFFLGWDLGPELLSRLHCPYND